MEYGTERTTIKPTGNLGLDYKHSTFIFGARTDVE